jgi:hypothetical protein
MLYRLSVLNVLLFISLASAPLIAIPSSPAPCQESDRPVYKMPRNLEGIAFQERPMLEELLQRIAVEARMVKSAYTFSIPLLGAALLGDTALYEEFREQMINALTRMERDTVATYDPALAAWLWGRVLLASYHMNDTPTEQLADQQMERFLLTASDQSAFSAWAYGYKAIYEGVYHAPTYPVSLAKGRHIAQSLSDPSQEGDWLWAQVMLLSATAFASDPGSYAEIEQQVLTQTSTENLAAAFSKIAENDWRAWALALARFATATLVPENLALHELTDAAEQSAAVSASEGNRLLSLLTLRWSQTH